LLQAEWVKDLDDRVDRGGSSRVGKRWLYLAVGGAALQLGAAGGCRGVLE
jgi:hypothetical protein